MSTVRAVRQIMRAIRVQEFGGLDKLLLEEGLSIPKPSENEVLIEVFAAGVNPVDTYIRAGTFTVVPTLPYTPGHDAAGVVEEVGSNVTQFKKGDRVLAVRTTSGSYADYVTANSLHVVQLSPNLSFPQGAAIGIPYFTAYKALHLRAHVKPGETVLVHGASGAVGIAATQIGKAFGLKVIGTAGTQEGLKIVMANGANEAFNHREEGYLEKIMKATEGRGVNVVLEMVANVNLQNDLSLLQAKGRVVVIGSHDSIEINPRLMMGKETSIMGLTLMSSSEAEWCEMKASIQAGQHSGWLKPLISQTYHLKDASKAQHDVIENNGTTGKLVLDLTQK